MYIEESKVSYRFYDEESNLDPIIKEFMDDELLPFILVNGNSSEFLSSFPESKIRDYIMHNYYYKYGMHKETVDVLIKNLHNYYLLLDLKFSNYVKSQCSDIVLDILNKTTDRDLTKFCNTVITSHKNRDILLYGSANVESDFNLLDFIWGNGVTSRLSVGEYLGFTVLNYNNYKYTTEVQQKVTNLHDGIKYVLNYSSANASGRSGTLVNYSTIYKYSATSWSKDLVVALFPKNPSNGYLVCYKYPINALKVKFTCVVQFNLGTSEVTKEIEISNYFDLFFKDFTKRALEKKITEYLCSIRKDHENCKVINLKFEVLGFSFAIAELSREELRNCCRISDVGAKFSPCRDYRKYDEVTEIGYTPRLTLEPGLISNNEIEVLAILHDSILLDVLRFYILLGASNSEIAKKKQDLYNMIFSDYFLKMPEYNISSGELEALQFFINYLESDRNSYNRGVYYISNEVYDTFLEEIYDKKARVYEPSKMANFSFLEIETYTLSQLYLKDLPYNKALSEEPECPNTEVYHKMYEKFGFSEHSTLDISDTKDLKRIMYEFSGKIRTTPGNFGSVYKSLMTSWNTGIFKNEKFLDDLFNKIFGESYII